MNIDIVWPFILPWRPFGTLFAHPQVDGHLSLLMFQAMCSGQLHIFIGIFSSKKGEEWGECNHRTRNARINSDFAVFRDLVKIKILSKRRGRVEEIRIRVGFGEKVPRRRWVRRKFRTS